MDFAIRSYQHVGSITRVKLAETSTSPNDEDADLNQNHHGVAKKVQATQNISVNVASSMPSGPQMIHDFNFGVPQASLKTTYHGLISSAPAFKFIARSLVTSNDQVRHVHLANDIAGSSQNPRQGPGSLTTVIQGPAN